MKSSVNENAVVKFGDPISEVDRLKAELRNWETWNIVEIAVRNRNVAEYVEHWEGRALKAEAALADHKKEDCA